MNAASASPHPDEIPAIQLDVVQINMLRPLRNGALLPQLLRTYRDQSTVHFTAIATAIAAKDADALRTVSHTLKSASYSIGAKRIGELCAQMEADSREGKLDNMAAICAELELLFAALANEIEQYL